MSNLYSGLVEKILLQLPPAVYQKSGVRHYHIYNQFVIGVLNRNGLEARLKEKGRETEVYYRVPFHLQECFRFLGYREGDFPKAKRTSRKLLALPTYSELTEYKQEMVVRSMRQFYD